MLTRYASPVIGATRIQQVTASDVDRVYRQMAAQPLGHHPLHALDPPQVLR
jgi:hypothetical protein